ncbi:hypothetical protein [Dactylosporangium darangshiense]|uniref:SprT-like domain-containing protein n=1 Tax=Dactylosporangium darangshiense TaxID=579108 RepID=A0ABP8DN64_9ACTN
MVEQVTTTVASWAAKIGKYLKALLASLRRLMPVLRRLGDLIRELRTLLHELRDGEHVADDALHRASPKRGAGPVQPYNMDSVRKIAETYGIDISELTIEFADVKCRGRQGNTFPNGNTRLFVPAFRSEEDLARTLVHELYHLHDIKAGKPFPRTEAELDLWEDRAYAHEQEWWDNQPIRPEPRGR